MSKKVIMLSVAVLFGLQAGLAMAANPDTGPGCGLGKLAWVIMRTRRTSRLR